MAPFQCRPIRARLTLKTLININNSIVKLLYLVIHLPDIDYSSLDKVAVSLRFPFTSLDTLFFAYNDNFSPQKRVVGLVNASLGKSLSQYFNNFKRKPKESRIRNGYYVFALSIKEKGAFKNRSYLSCSCFTTNHHFFLSFRICE